MVLIQTTYKEDSTRFKVYELNNKSITINPGDSYYVTYTLKIKPEVYAAMQSDSVTIKNRYYTYSGSEELDKVGNRDLTLTEYKWVDKDVAKPTTSEETINMDGKNIIINLMKIQVLNNHLKCLQEVISIQLNLIRQIKIRRMESLI